MALRWGVALGLSIGLLSRAAEANDTFRLTYVRESGVESCPDEKAFRARITQEIGRDPFDDEAAKSLTLLWRAESKRLHVTVVATNEKGEAHTAAEHHAPLHRCDRLFADAMFSAVMVVEPLDMPEEAQEEPPAEPPALTPPPPPPPALPLPAPPPFGPPGMTNAAASVRRGLVSFGVGGGLGSMPAPSLALAGGLGLRWAPFSISVEGRWEYAHEPRSSFVITEGTHKRGLVAPCTHQRVLPRLTLDECALIAVGRLDVTSDLAPEMRGWKTSTWTFGLGLRGGLSFPLSSSFTLQARLDFLYTPMAPRLVIDGHEVWSLPSGSATLQLGAIYTFGQR